MPAEHTQPDTPASSSSDAPAGARPLPPMTDRQLRTLDMLVGRGPRPAFPAPALQRIRSRIEEDVAELGLQHEVVLTKGRLTDADRCEGRFDAALRKEQPPFRHTQKSAAGLLMHRAIELDVCGRAMRDVHAIVELASARLRDEDPGFAEHLTELDDVGVDELVMRATEALVLFRETFPPIRAMRGDLVPLTEWHLRAELAGGALSLDGRIDLSLGRQDPPSRAGAPVPAGRLLLDLKGAGAWPGHAEDMRFYALVHALRFGVPPYRVATVLLSSGEWQLEDVDERTLERAADRVIAAVRIAADLQRGRPPSLVAGPYCAWCPRRSACPAAW